MPRYRFQGPDGRIHLAEADSPEAAQAGLERMWSQQAADRDARGREAKTPGWVRAMARGGTFGFVDKLDGASAAVETALNPSAAYSPGQAYDAVVRANQGAAQGYAKEHPAANFAYSVAGGMKAPGVAQLGKWAAAAGNLPALMARSALVGGGYGVAYGAGEATPGDEARGAVEGGAAGAIVGGALPAAATTTVRAAKAAARPALALLGEASGLVPGGGGKIGAAARAAPTAPELRAAQAVQKAMARDAVAGQPLQPGVSPMYGGENVQALFEQAAKAPGQARAMIRDAAEANRAAAFDDMRNDLGRSLGGAGDYLAALEELATKRRINAAAGMEKLGDQMVTLDGNSISALRSDLAQKAVREAAQIGLASPEPQARAAAESLDRLARNVMTKGGASITVRQAQDVSEKLLRAADTAYRTGDGARGAALKELGRAIRLNARSTERGGLAAYDDWLKQYATDSEAERALALGADVFKGGLKKSPEAVQRSLSKMGQDAVLHYRKGVAEALMDKLHSSGGDVGLIRRVLSDRNLTEKLRLAFPTDASFADFIGSVERRALQARADSRYMAAAAADASQFARANLEPSSSLLGAVLDAMGAGPVKTAGRAARSALRAIPARQRAVLADKRANAALGRAATDPAALDDLIGKLGFERRLHVGAGRAGARAAPVVSGMTAER